MLLKASQEEYCGNANFEWGALAKFAFVTRTILQQRRVEAYAPIDLFS